MNCILCGQRFYGMGNNPEPVASYGDGRCCDDCNNNVVIPERIARIVVARIEAKEEADE